MDFTCFFSAPGECQQEAIKLARANCESQGGRWPDHGDAGKRLLHAFNLMNQALQSDVEASMEASAMGCSKACLCDSGKFLKRERKLVLLPITVLFGLRVGGVVHS